MKRVAVIAAAVAFGVVPGASAKAPPDGFRVCGPASCVAITGEDAEWIATSVFYFDIKSELAAGPPPASFYVLHWTSSQTGREQTVYYIASADAFGSARHAPTVAPGWFALSAEAQMRLARITAGLEPFTAPTLTRVVVDRKTARDPSSYSVLWTLGAPVSGYQWPRGGWLRVRIVTDLPSPWQGTLLIGRRANLLMRDGSVYPVPSWMAIRVRARAPLR